MKLLVHDEGVAKAVIVFSDALAAFNLTSDSSRRKVMFLKDFSRREADLYFNVKDFGKKVGQDWETKKEYFYSSVGMHPGWMREFMESDVSVEQFCNDKILHESNKIVFSLGDSKDYIKIYEELLKKPNLTVEEVARLEGCSLKPADLLGAVKAHHVLSYNVETECFAFRSVATKTAARNLKQRGWFKGHFHQVISLNQHNLLP